MIPEFYSRKNSNIVIITYKLNLNYYTLNALTKARFDEIISGLKKIRQIYNKEVKILYKKKCIFLFLLICLCFLSGCAPNENKVQNTPSENGEIAGFWLGLWHGIIAPITFIISLFNKSVNMYEIHNDGGWYNFGFALGTGILMGGSSSASSKE